MKKFKDEINPHNFSDSISVAFQNGMINAKNLIVKFINEWCDEHGFTYKDSFGFAEGDECIVIGDLKDAIEEYLKD